MSVETTAKLEEKVTAFEERDDKEKEELRSQLNGVEKRVRLMEREMDNVQDSRGSSRSLHRRLFKKSG